MTFTLHKDLPLRSFAQGTLALLVLNAFLSFSTWWPTPFVVLDARVAPEFILLWVVILLLVWWRGPLGRRSVGLQAGLYGVLVLGRYADVTVPALFGRPINAYWDVPQIPRFLWVAAQEWPAWKTAFILGAGLLLLTLMGAIVRWGIGLLGRTVAPAAVKRPWAWWVSAAALAVAAANYAGVQATWPYVSKPVIPVAWRQAQVLVGAWSSARQGVLLPSPSPVDVAREAPPESTFAALAGADFYLMPLESIGAITYDDPDMNRTLEPLRLAFERSLRDGGYEV
ncbi:MAG: hypothetical protein ACO26F_11520, partial [Burkholderiaceae bacterium]